MPEIIIDEEFKQLTYYRGVHYNLDKNIHGGDRQSKEYSRGHNEPLSGITCKYR
ncbi:MAG: hypothetical protein LBD23_01910 [Oscillospiraceae bacterium]|jgi:hypothetical protein|nr:hypothetical protein [Oscillospiraceae bacterium]